MAITLFLFFQDPKPLPYLCDDQPYTFDINLFVSVKGTPACTFWFQQEWCWKMMSGYSQYFPIGFICFNVGCTGRFTWSSCLI